MKHEYPCMKCNSVFTRVSDLVQHETRQHPRIKKLLIKAVKRQNTNEHINNAVVVPDDSYSRHESDEEKPVARIRYSRRNTSLLQETIKSESDDFGDDLDSDHSVDSMRFGNLISNVPLMKKKRKSRLSDSQLAAIARAKIIVGDRTLFHCDECGKNIMHQFSYLTHLRIHTGEKPFTCHVCGRQFRTASQLVRHVNDVHEGIKKHPCDICGRMFAHARARNEHRRTHTEERPCVCHVCGKAFRTKASLYVHNTFHMNVFKYQCPHCDRQFRRRQELNDHIMIHTGEKPFACETCAKSFRQRQELKRHLLTHSSEKPYECPTCKQCFSQKRYLRNHSKTHNSTL